MKKKKIYWKRDEPIRVILSLMIAVRATKVKMATLLTLVMIFLLGLARQRVKVE